MNICRIACFALLIAAAQSRGATIHSYEFAPGSYTANGVTISLAGLTGGPIETGYYGRFEVPYDIAVSGEPATTPTDLVLWEYADIIPVTLTLDVEQDGPIIARDLVTVNLLAATRIAISPFGFYRGTIALCPVGCEAAAITQGWVKAFGSPEYARSGDSPGPGRFAMAVESYAIPEPGTWLLLASGLGLIAIARARSGRHGC